MRVAPRLAQWLSLARPARPSSLLILISIMLYHRDTELAPWPTRLKGQGDLNMMLHVAVAIMLRLEMRVPAGVESGHCRSERAAAGHSAPLAPLLPRAPCLLASTRAEDAARTVKGNVRSRLMA